jgi:hypothetical protein
MKLIRGHICVLINVAYQGFIKVYEKIRPSSNSSVMPLKWSKLIKFKNGSAKLSPSSLGPVTYGRTWQK